MRGIFSMRRKQLSALLFTLLLFVCFAGCGTRTAVTQEAFTAAMDTLGAKAVEAGDPSATAGSGAQEVLIYQTASGGGAMYCLYADASTTREVYANLVSNIQAQEGAAKDKQVDSATYNFAQYTVGASSYAVIRTDATLLFLNDTKDGLTSLLSALGYA